MTDRARVHPSTSFILSMNFPPATFRIFVHDLAVGRRFYQDVIGWHLSSFTEDWLYFTPGTISVVVEYISPENWKDRNLVGRFTGLSLHTLDIQRDYEELREQGVEFTSPPARKPWGGTLADFKDPAGNILTLFEREPKEF